MPTIKTNKNTNPKFSLQCCQKSIKSRDKGLDQSNSANGMIAGNIGIIVHIKNWNDRALQQDLQFLHSYMNDVWVRLK